MNLIPSILLMGLFAYIFFYLRKIVDIGMSRLLDLETEPRWYDIPLKWVSASKIIGEGTGLRIFVPFAMIFTDTWDKRGIREKRGLVAITKLATSYLVVILLITILTGKIPIEAPFKILLIQSIITYTDSVDVIILPDQIKMLYNATIVSAILLHFSTARDFFDMVYVLFKMGVDRVFVNKRNEQIGEITCFVPIWLLLVFVVTLFGILIFINSLTFL
jgi:hypothetical protein